MQYFAGIQINSFFFLQIGSLGPNQSVINEQVCVISFSFFFLFFF